MKIETDSDSSDSNKKNLCYWNIETIWRLPKDTFTPRLKKKKACVPKIWINNLTGIFNESGLFGTPLATWLNSTILFTIMQPIFAYLFAVGISYYWKNYSEIIETL